MGSKAPKRIDFALPVLSNIVRVEKNLGDMGFFSASAPSKNLELQPTVRRIEWVVVRNGKRVKIAAEIRGSALGLPRTPDRDKFMAFMGIILSKRKTQGPLTNPISFSGSEMLKALDLSDGSLNYKEITIWGKRMADTTITSEQVIYFAKSKRYVDDTVHLFRRFTVEETTLNSNSKERLKYTVYLEDWLLDNINESYFVPQDFAQYKRLTRPISKGLFAHLSIWFYATNGKKVEKDYADLCTLLDITRYKYPAKIVETMKSSLDELKQIGYLKEWNFEPMRSKEGQKLVMYAGPALLALISKQQQRQLPGKKNPSSPQILTPNEEIVRAKLCALGVSEDKAADMCRAHDPEIVLRQLEYITQTLRETGNRIENPAGFAISYIEKKTAVPDSFETESQRAARQQQTNSEREVEDVRRQREHELQMDRHVYKEWCEEQAVAFINNRYTPEDLEHHLKQIGLRLAKHGQEGPKLQRMSRKAQREVQLRTLVQEVMSEVPLIPFETWRDSNAQSNLFKN